MICQQLFSLVFLPLLSLPNPASSLPNRSITYSIPFPVLGPPIWAISSTVPAILSPPIPAMENCVAVVSRQHADQRFVVWIRSLGPLPFLPPPILRFVLLQRLGHLARRLDRRLGLVAILCMACLLSALAIHGLSHDRARSVLVELIGAVEGQVISLEVSGNRKSGGWSWSADHRPLSTNPDQITPLIDQSPDVCSNTRLGC